MSQLAGRCQKNDPRQLCFNFQSSHEAADHAAAALIFEIARHLRPGRIRGVQVKFRPFRSTIYSYRINPDGIARFNFHVAFRAAPEIVLRQATEVILCRRSKDRRHLKRNAYDAFVRSLPASAFELPGARPRRRRCDSSPGKFRSLEESFRRVNASYFNSGLKQPELCWSPVRARRLLGSYHERTDRLIISRVFDSQKVPIFVLDYLMYHELLHKFLGIGRRCDGRRDIHSPAFRQKEKEFQNYKDAQQFLKKI